MHTTLGSDTQQARRPTARSAILTAILSFIFALVSLVGMAPAHAATTLRGCTLTPVKPYAFQGRVMYPIAVNCQSGRTVEITQRFYEDDGATDQATHSVRRESVRFVTSGTVWTNYTSNTGYAPPNTEAGAEELYHTVSFRVNDAGGWSASTAAEKSANLVL